MDRQKEIAILCQDVSDKDQSEKGNTLEGGDGSNKNEMLSKFIPLFAQKTMGTKYDTLAAPKSGVESKIPKEALQKPFCPITSRDDIIHKIDIKLTNAERNRMKQKKMNDKMKSVRHKTKVSPCS